MKHVHRYYAALIAIGCMVTACGHVQKTDTQSSLQSSNVGSGQKNVRTKQKKEERKIVFSSDVSCALSATDDPGQSFYDSPMHKISDARFWRITPDETIDVCNLRCHQGEPNELTWSKYWSFENEQMVTTIYRNGEPVFVYKFPNKPYQASDIISRALNHYIHDDNRIRSVSDFGATAPIGDVIFRDINQDGHLDILIYKGNYGASGINRFDGFEWNDETQKFVTQKVLIDMGNPMLSASDNTLYIGPEAAVDERETGFYYKYLVSYDEEPLTEYLLVGQLYANCMGSNGRYRDYDEEDMNRSALKCQYDDSRGNQSKKRDGYEDLPGFWKDYLHTKYHEFLYIRGKENGLNKICMDYNVPFEEIGGERTGNASVSVSANPSPAFPEISDIKDDGIRCDPKDANFANGTTADGIQWERCYLNQNLHVIYLKDNHKFLEAELIPKKDEDRSVVEQWTSGIIERTSLKNYDKLLNKPFGVPVLMDLNFDGVQDILVYKGRYSVDKNDYYDAYLWNESAHQFDPPASFGDKDYLKDIANIVTNPHDKSLMVTALVDNYGFQQRRFKRYIWDRVFFEIKEEIEETMCQYEYAYRNNREKCAFAKSSDSRGCFDETGIIIPSKEKCEYIGAPKGFTDLADMFDPTDPKEDDRYAYWKTYFKQYVHSQPSVDAPKTK
ncbi:MAG: hypothetical protein J6A01_01290 [Proteobacteria bacterium]|nr:hypothetical protein [Pseudomonadota bacterium]